MTLEQLADEAHQRVAAAAARVPLGKLTAQALDAAVVPGFPVERALAAPGLSFIGEVSLAVRSDALVATDFQRGGAVAIAVTTGSNYVLDRDQPLIDTTAGVTVPVIWQDCFVDPYQVYLARQAGASAIRLVPAILGDESLADLIECADQLGLTGVVEVFGKAEIDRSVKTGARVIGLNLLTPSDASVDLGRLAQLRAFVPPDRIVVVQSDIATVAAAADLATVGVDAVVVGPALRRTPDWIGLLQAMRAATAEARRPAYTVNLTDWARPDRPLPASPTPAELVVAVPDGLDVMIGGISRDEDVASLNEALPDYAGFAFHSADRHQIDLPTALRLRAGLDQRVATVGVFVDAEVTQVIDAVNAGAVSVVQLCGQEDEDYLAELRAGLATTLVIKAVDVGQASDIGR